MGTVRWPVTVRNRILLRVCAYVIRFVCWITRFLGTTAIVFIIIIFNALQHAHHFRRGKWNGEKKILEEVNVRSSVELFILILHRIEEICCVRALPRRVCSGWVANMPTAILISLENVFAQELGLHSTSSVISIHFGWGFYFFFCHSRLIRWH